MFRMKKYTFLAVMVFFLLYYIYMNVIRKVMIPGSGVVVPLILALLACAVLLSSKKRPLVIVGNRKVRLLIVCWVLICSIIMANNISLIEQLLYGGMIQLYVMVLFLAFTNDDTWYSLWMKWTKAAGLLYAVSTIVFYFNHALYSRFVVFFYPDLSKMLEKFYSFGWMSGLCDHFSTNGMVLASGLMILSLEILTLREQKDTTSLYSQIFLYLSFFVVLYGLILSSKRAPLICFCLSMGITYYISFSKRKSNALFSFCIVAGIMFLLYEFLLPYIPGLSTIADKFLSTSENGDLLQGRNILWAVAFDMIASSPILGHGFGSYAVITEKMHLFTTTAHNYYLQVFAELGIVGLSMYVFAFLLGVRLTLDTMRKIRNSRESVPQIELFTIRFALAFQLFVLFYNISASALTYYIILIPYFLSLTAVCILSRKYKEV